MKNLVCVSFHSLTTPHHINSILSLTEGRAVVHFHDPASFTTSFHAWFTQLKKRTGRKHLRTSRWRANEDGLLYDGKELPEKKKNPERFYTIRWPRGVKAQVLPVS